MDDPPGTLVGRRVAAIGWALYGRAADFPDPDAVDPESLYDRDWISLGDKLAGIKAVQFVRERVAPERVSYKLDTVLGLAEAVEAGLGIGHLPCFLAHAPGDLVRLSPPTPAFAADLWLLPPQTERPTCR